MLAQLFAHLYGGEHLGHEVGGGFRHHGIGVGDDEGVHAGGRPLHGFADGLGPIAGVDVGPHVPLALLGVVVVGREFGIVGGLHYIRKSQAHELHIRRLVAELASHVFHQNFGQGVGAFGAQRIILVHGRVGGGLVKGLAQGGFATGPDDVADAQPPGRLEHVVGAHDVVLKNVGIGNHARGGNGRQVHHGIKRLRGHARVDFMPHGGQRVQRLAEIGEVGHHVGHAFVGRHGVHHEHVVAVGLQIGHAHFTELASAARHQHSRAGLLVA